MFRLSVLMVGLALVVSGCNSRLIGLDGSGPIELSPEIEAAYQDYLKSDPIVFSVATDGSSSWHGYICKGVVCSGPTGSTKSTSVGHCQANGTGYSGTGIICRVYDIRGRIVWDKTGPIIEAEDEAEAEAEAEEPIVVYNGKFTKIQKASFDVYLGRVSRKDPSMAFAFAISNEGHSFSSYSKELAPYQKLKNLVIQHCEITYPGKTCFLYAVNEKVVIEE